MFLAKKPLGRILGLRLDDLSKETLRSKLTIIIVQYSILQLSILTFPRSPSYHNHYHFYCTYLHVSRISYIGVNLNFEC